LPGRRVEPPTRAPAAGTAGHEQAAATLTVLNTNTCGNGGRPILHRGEERRIADCAARVLAESR
jgi:hypothetical protein